MQSFDALIEKRKFFPRKKKILLTIATICLIVGYGLLLWTDWRIPIGIFLVVFVHNLTTGLEKEEEQYAYLDAVTTKRPSEEKETPSK